MKPQRIGAILLLLFCAASATAGPLTFSFTSSLLTAFQGQTVTFSATLTNPGATNLFLNGDSTNIAAPLTANDTKFFLNTPLFLTPGQSVTAPILDLTVPLGTSFGLYAGDFHVLGGSTDTDFTDIGSANFAVQVVPEPATVVLLVSCALFLLRLRCTPGDRCTSPPRS